MRYINSFAVIVNIMYIYSVECRTSLVLSDNTGSHCEFCSYVDRMQSGFSVLVAFSTITDHLTRINSPIKTKFIICK